MVFGLCFIVWKFNMVMKRKKKCNDFIYVKDEWWIELNCLIKIFFIFNFYLLEMIFIIVDIIGSV